MAKYSIYSADGTIVRFTGTPRYNGVFGKPSYIEFTEISSPTPIDWAIGDYVEYTRTGHTYRLYSIPQPKKQAEKNKYGASFIYRNVQFYAATKDLTIAPFRDLILNDNLIHYSTLPDVSTFEDVYGIADRIQACLNDLYPDKWIVRVKEMTDPTDELYIKLHEVQEFVVSNGTCLDALDKVYQQWKGIGWVHTFENGKEVITIGRPNIRDAENTTSVFSYKGNGLTVIARENSRSNEFATRLYAYGSDRNMIARYYNNLSPVIHNAESVYLPNVMLPRAFWGTTDGKKDARKAYIQTDAATIAKYGIIPKIVYFNSDEYGDIYPSIERVTAKNIRDAKTAMGDTAYVPNTTIYPDNTPIDEIKSVANPTDNGIVNVGGNKYISENTYNFAASSESVTGSVPAKIKDTDRPIFVSIDELNTLLSQTNSQAELLLITPNTTITLTSTITISYASVMLDLVVNGKVYESLTLFEGSINDTTKTIDTTAFKKHYIPTNAEYKLVPRVLVKYDRGTTKQDYTLTANVAAGTVDVSAELALSTTFNLRIKQIGFDISKQGSSSQGLATMSFKSGNCAGRDFTIQKCTYNAATDDWSLTILRSADDTLGQLFPNSIYPITTGDKFVFTDMVMPPIYIYLAESKLAEKATDLLTYLSSPKPVYTPEIDAKKMAESPQTLIEGMYMHLTDTDIIVGDEYVLIDTLTIDESGTIPTYSVTLRDEKKSSLQNLKKKLGFPITPRDTGRQDEGLPVDLLTRSGDTTITKNYYGNDGLDSVNIVMSHQSRLFEAGAEYAVEGSDTITFYAYRGIDIIPFTFGEIQNSVSGVTVTTENNTATVTIADTVSTPFGIIVFPIIAAGETYNLQYSWALSFKGSSGMNTAIVYLYKRSATKPTRDFTTPIVYNFNTGFDDTTYGTWRANLGALTGADPIWVMAATALEDEDSPGNATIAANQWSEPVKWAGDGAPGLNSATVMLYQRAASAPAKPAGALTYTFATGALSGTLGSWSQTIPASNGQPCWVIQATAISSDATDVIAATEWSDVRGLVADGATGLRNAIVYLYKRSATTPTRDFTTNVTYDFSTGFTASTYGTWKANIADATGSDELWVLAATARETTPNGGTAVILPSQWAAPVKPAENGLNSATAVLYQRAASAPAKPAGALTYTFATGVLSGTLGNWSQTIPASNGQPCWVIQATAISSGATDVIEASEWSTAVKLVEDGMNGCPLRGVTEWQAGRRYEGGNPRAGDEYQDIVVYDGSFYVCTETHTATAAGTPPTLLGTKWKAGSQFDFVATKIAYIKKTLIENAVIDTLQTQEVNGGRIEAIGDRVSSYKNNVEKLKIHSGNLSPLAGGGNNTYDIASSSKTHSHEHTTPPDGTPSPITDTGGGESTLAIVNPTLEYNQVTVPALTIGLTTNASEANGTSATIYWSLVFGDLLISNGMFTGAGNITTPAKTVSLPKGVNSTLKLYYSYELMSQGDQVTFTLTSNAKSGNAIVYVVSGFTEIASDGFKSQWASNKYLYIDLDEGMKMQYGNARMELDATNGIKASHTGATDTYAVVGKDVKEIKVVTAMPSTPDDKTLYIVIPSGA